MLLHWSLDGRNESTTNKPPGRLRVRFLVCVVKNRLNDPCVVGPKFWTTSKEEVFNVHEVRNKLWLKDPVLKYSQIHTPRITLDQSNGVFGINCHMWPSQQQEFCYVVGLDTTLYLCIYLFILLITSFLFSTDLEYEAGLVCP